MVKGISRQVIVLHGQDKALFDQAIFILKDKAVAGDGVTDEQLLKEAKRLMGSQPKGKGAHGLLWACAGAFVTGIAWFLSIFL